MNILKSLVIMTALMVTTSSAIVHAQTAPAFPSKLVTIVVPAAPGGSYDYIGRLLGEGLAKELGQAVVVENRPGAGTVVGTQYVVKSAADGYTIVVGGVGSIAHAAAVVKDLPYNPAKDLVPLQVVATNSFTLAARPDFAPKNLQELIAYAKDKPDTLNYGSQGTGTTGHIGMERFKLMAGIEIVHVPYKGAAPALMDLLAAQIQVVFASTSTIRPYITGGKVRPLAISSLQRSPLYPDLPTIAEAGVPGFELKNTYSSYAPAGTPRAIISAINAVVTEGMNVPDLVKSLAADGTEVAVRATPDEFKARFDREYAELEKLIGGVKITVN